MRYAGCPAQIGASDGEPRRYALKHAETLPQPVTTRQVLKRLDMQLGCWVLIRQCGGRRPGIGGASHSGSAYKRAAWILNREPCTLNGRTRRGTSEGSSEHVEDWKLKGADSRRLFSPGDRFSLSKARAPAPGAAGLMLACPLRCRARRNSREKCSVIIKLSLAPLPDPQKALAFASNDCASCQND